MEDELQYLIADSSPSICDLYLFEGTIESLIIVMFNSQSFNRVARAASRRRLPVLPTLHPRYVLPNIPISTRLLSSSSTRASDGSKDDPYRPSSTAAAPTDKQAHEGSFSRTDREVSFQYPDEQDFPRSQIVQGRGGPHMKRTLPSFSLEGKVAVVTGGARGLGLVMGQALVTSGANLAIVDLNSQS